MAETNATQCTPCKQGYYQDQEGQESCTKCALHQSTQLLAATGIVECMCVEGYFREDPQSSCGTCGKGTTCPFGAEMQQYWNWNNAGRNATKLEDLSFPRVNSGFTSDPSKPLSIFKCKSSVRCPGGPPGTCGPKLLTDVGSCAHCKDQWYWDGEVCIECSDFEISSVLFPALPCALLPIIIIFVYRLFRDDPDKWGSWQNGVAAVGFILLNHFQITTLASSANIELHTNIKAWFDAFSFSEDMLSLFKPQCAGFASFEKTMITRSLGPIILAIAFFLVFLRFLDCESCKWKTCGYGL
jgi:hypothetical protein